MWYINKNGDAFNLNCAKEIAIDSKEDPECITIYYIDDSSSELETFEDTDLNEFKFFIEFLITNSKDFYCCDFEDFLKYKNEIKT